ncbi:helicase associated domain-containing protein [Streptomyces phaeofaciens]|uniref:helicase associated domain-containing protein n=1 Tax=Streptomyces phaeofaciens TaxID=68254 RepID=UPI001E469529|nr:helicase associated domain-containing protein [Streptomyces phaeofaciens]
MDLASFDPRDPAVSRSRRLGLAAAQSYRDQYGHLAVPAADVDPTDHALGTFITTMRDAAKAGRLEADWIAELDALGMIWDKHDAARRSRLAAATDYLHAHGHLAAPATTPVGAWLALAPRLAPAPRSGLAPQVPPAARPPRRRRRPGRTHPRHPPRRREDRLLARPPAHRLARSSPRPAAADDHPRPHPPTPTRSPPQAAPAAPSSRPSSSWSSSCTAKAAPPPPARRSVSTATRCQDRRLARQGPHQAPHGPAARRAPAPGRRLVRRRPDR